MDRSNLPPLRSLPRVFLDGLTPEQEVIDLPKTEVKKLQDVLRLRPGSPIAVLPGDGTIWRCTFYGTTANRETVETMASEPTLRVTLAQAMPRAEKLEEVIRMGTEIGVAEFVVFDSDRTMVHWDARKKVERLVRLQAIARESAEQSFRARVPKIRFAGGLQELLGETSVVLSEVERVEDTLSARLANWKENTITLVIGPEGGWSPREVELIGPAAATMGPRVLRVDTAAAAACSLALLR